MDKLDKIWAMNGYELEMLCHEKGWAETGVKAIMTSQFKDHPLKCLHYLVDNLPEEKRYIALVKLMMVFGMKPETRRPDVPNPD